MAIAISYAGKGRNHEQFLPMVTRQACGHAGTWIQEYLASFQPFLVSGAWPGCEVGMKSCLWCSVPARQDEP